MKILLSQDVIKDIKELRSRDIKLFKKIKKQLRLFFTDHTHPSLRTHKLKGNLNNLWSISIDMKIRMVYVITKHNEAYFTDIGTHSEVYK